MNTHSVTAGLVEQLDWHWQQQLRPRFDGLSDGEYFWEPVPGCWSVHPDGSVGWHYATDATTALQQLDQAYAGWITGVRTLSDSELDRPCGPAEGPYADHPVSALVLHINREVIHHGAEIACIRDLYLHQTPKES